MNEFNNFSIETAASVNNNVGNVPWVNKTFNGFQQYLHSVFPNSHCESFLAINHAYFQLANIFFLLSYFAPNRKCGLIYLRCMLLIGCVFFAIWGFEILCTLDALIWNVTFIICNIVHILILVIQIWPSRFTKEIEDVSMEHSVYFLVEYSWKK